MIDNSKFFKECDRQSSTSVIDCADLFIPDFTRIKPIDDRSQWSGNEEFMLTLTDGLGKRYIFFGSNTNQGVNKFDSLDMSVSLLFFSFFIYFALHFCNF